MPSKSYVVAMEANWQGVASNTFQELMREWDAYAAQLQNARCSPSRAALDPSADNFASAPSTSNLANLNNVSLPKANLS